MTPTVLAVLLHSFAVLPDPTVVGAVTPADAQWAVAVATARVGDGSYGGPAATAVCIGVRDGAAYLLTASHVVPKGEPRVYEFFTKASYPRPERSLTGGTVVFRSENADVALVKLPVGMRPVPAVTLAGPGRRPKRFPFGGVSVGCPGSVPPKCRAEKVIGKRLVRLPEGGMAFYWEVEVAAAGGMSGGPLVDADGRVIGICAATQGGRGYFSHTDEILALLKGNGYSWLYEPPFAR